MEKHKPRHLLADLWESYPEAVSNTYTVSQSTPIGKYIADILALGPFYHYVINIPDYSLSHISERTLDIHGLADYPTTLQNIMDLIHPDDLGFVVDAERATLEKLKEIGFRYQLSLKTSYCFRMRIADGSYHLFHHQAIHLSKDAQGRMTTTLNIHTDIQHITQVNNRIVLISGVGERTDYCQINLSRQHSRIPTIPLSKREREILKLLSQGLSNQQISEQLFISDHTVRTHRRNLLKKTATNNSHNLIRECLEQGLF